MTAPRAPVQRLSAAPRDGDGDACYRVVVEFALSRDGGSSTALVTDGDATFELVLAGQWAVDLEPDDVGHLIPWSALGFAEESTPAPPDGRKIVVDGSGGWLYAAAPDVFPPDRFNAGVLVIRPDAETSARLKAAAPTAASHDGGDTGLLNTCFPDWFAGAPRLARLPFAYNAQRTLHWFTHAKAPGYWDACKPIKILHFSSAPKPWQSPDKKGVLEMFWWDQYLAAQLSQLAPAETAGPAPPR